MVKGELYEHSEEDFANDVATVQTLIFDNVLSCCINKSNDIMIEDNVFDIIVKNITECFSFKAFQRLDVTLKSIDVGDHDVTIELRFNNAKDSPVVPFSVGIIC